MKIPYQNIQIDVRVCFFLIYGSTFFDLNDKQNMYKKKQYKIICVKNELGPTSNENTELK